MLLLVLPLLAASCVIAQDVVTVSTTYGDVNGRTFYVHGYNDPQLVVNVSSFWGIPYVAPPVGDLRFAKPEPHPGWTEPLDAFAPHSMCPQSSRVIWYTHPAWFDYTEDCLNLNIFAPTDAEPGTLPVMVDFHGGAYVSGGNVQYPGYFLAMRDVVVVVVNYRLGVLGFMSTEGYPGNWALHDQIASLEWVRDNIGGFGGDPNRVTVFGQSAGASSTGLHLVSQLSTGLFHQAICESGSEMAFWAANYPQQDPDSYSDQVAEAYGCPTDDKAVMVDCMRTIDAREIVNFNITCTDGYFCQGFAPVIDGPGGFLPDYPYNIREAGLHNDVPLISGQNTEDGSFYTIAFIPEAMDGGFTREQFLYHLEYSLLSIWEGQLTESQFDDLFEAFAWYYAPWPHINSSDANREAFNTIITDAGFGYTGDAQIKHHQKTQFDTWHYLFGYRGTTSVELYPEWMGVPHMGELPYVWGYPFLTMPENEHLRDDCLLYFDIIDWTLEDIEYAEYTSDLWTNFAKSGNPNEPVPVAMPFGLDPVEWPRYNRDTYDYYMMDWNVTQEAEYRQRNFAFFTEYMAYIVDQSMLTGIPNGSGSKKRTSGGMSAGTVEEAFNDFIVKAWEGRLNLD